MKLFSNPILQKSLRKLRPEKVEYNGLILPAPHIRTGGAEFKDNAYFMRSARHEIQRLIDHFDFTGQDTLLDIGCGFGRLPIGLLDIFGTACYTGIDINPIAIEWCHKYIGNVHSDFQFIQLDIQNDRYNPNGQPLTEKFRFDFSNSQFKLAYLYSVFSHMIIEDIQIYLKELNRVLDTDGHLFFTAFAEENVPDMEINPSDYGTLPWSAALHCVRFNLSFLESILNSAGFHIDQFEHGKETNGQSAFYLSKI